MSPFINSNVRPSAIAGTWYPGNAPVLRRTIEEYLAQVRSVTLPGRVLALVSPHAGYAYSGPTAAHAYAQVRGADFQRVVLMGPLHQMIRGSQLGAFMVPLEDAYRTPLGDVPLDHDFIAELGRRVTLTRVRGDKEHSLEIELPFLQVALGQFSLVPIMFGEYISDPGVLGRLDALAAVLAELSDANTLLVSSTDLSHLNNYADVVRIDQQLVELVDAFDVEGVSAALQTGQVMACGATGLVATLKTAQKLGARGARVLAHTTSGDVTGDKRPGAYCVGYMAVAVYA